MREWVFMREMAGVRVGPIPSKDSGQAKPSPLMGEGRIWIPAKAGKTVGKSLLL